MSTKSQNDSVGYSALIKHFNKNKNKLWSEWLEVEKIFPRPGKQGLVGLMRLKIKPEIKFVFKLSQYINYLVHHELEVMTGLNDLSIFCLHFCKSVGAIICKVDPNITKDGNPFEISGKHHIEKEVLLCEYLDNSTKLYNFIKSKNNTENCIFSIVKQVLLALCVAQKKKKFTHYDLHSNNIMMKKCDKNLVFLYIIDKETQFCVPTHGNYPVIIDFGFSFIDNMNDGPLWPSMGHTEVGFYSNQFDKFSDAKLFLVTISGELNQIRKTKTTCKFKNMVKNIFSELKIDWFSGWDKNKQSASDYVSDIIENFSGRSEVFEKYNVYCIDIIQTLIILPLEQQDYSNIHISYKTFVNEFVKIENEIGNSLFNLYILKKIVDVAREVRPVYMKKDKKDRDKAVKFFQMYILESLNTIVKFCRPKNIHYEKMLCSLLCFSRSMEGIFYDEMHIVNKKNQKRYERLPLQNIENIYGVIDINIPDEYEFNEQTQIIVMDCVNEVYGTLKLNNEQTIQVNQTHSINTGVFLYDIYNQQK